MAEKGRRPRPKATQVYDIPEPVDHTAEEAGFDDRPPDGSEEPNGDDRVKGRGPIATAIARHNALAPTPHRAGRELLEPPTAPNAAPTGPRLGVAAPGAPVLDADRAACSQTPDSGSGFPGQLGADRPLTPAPGPGVAESATKALRDGATGQYTDAAGLPGGVVTLDLGAMTGGDAAPHFSRANVTLPGHAANGPSTRQPNTSRDERNGQ